MNPKENIFSVYESPRFDPWRVEGDHQLFTVSMKVKRGTLPKYFDQFRQLLNVNQHPLFAFYSPAGLEMTAEIFEVNPPEEQTSPYFDTLDLLVSLTPDQVMALFPYDEEYSFGY